MKKACRLTDAELEIIYQFARMKYPPIYKTDKTDRILFVESVDFDVCPYLLGKKTLKVDQYNSIMFEYERYLKQTNPLLFDEYAKSHYEIIVTIMNLLKKYYSFE